ncbi:ribosome biogenesis GTPase Der [Spiroplasma endosymbiont of Crioceris asparagi]|uniref:ribosome biogenesis GTPase Der n=1 Tax=Spiroplasma endosymbiont of Crioceris asparagi TaxID=3066286 RepID=UPI0030D4574A
MSKKSIVAIVGRPNVGKSTLFNRIIKERKAIVDDTPGVTRDRLYAVAEWLNREFILVDTGGITLQETDFSKEIRMQSEIAIEEADAIIFVIDYKRGIEEDDKQVAKILYKTKKPIILIVNKYDNKTQIDEAYNFMTLGLGMPIMISAEHGIGVGDLLDKTIEVIKKPEVTESENDFRVAIVGKPNVGKSSLVNAILNEKRMIVSNVPGTTTDSVDSSFVYKNNEYTLVDTAGMRKKGRIFENLEKYSYLRSISTINKADVVLLVIDISQPVTDHDTNIGGFAFEEKKPILIIANKWDLVDKNSTTILKKEEEIRAYFKYLKYAEIIFTSAIEKQRVHKIFDLVEGIKISLKKRVRTSVLNEIINKAQLLNPAPNHNGGRLKILYSSQVDAYIPTFVLFVNDVNYMHFSYKRYIENQIRNQFAFKGVPINIIVRERT